MRIKILLIIFILSLPTLSFPLDFFSTAYIETYRTDLQTTMVSPNLYFKLGKLEGYGFIDRYFDSSEFYHAEFQLSFTPINKKQWDRFSIIAEKRWDKFAKDENSIGVKVKIW
jgi:hypothetical protein